MQQIEKCPHGVFKAGEPIARACSLCTTVVVPCAPRMRRRPDRDELRTLDVAEFLSQPADERLASL